MGSCLTIFCASLPPSLPPPFPFAPSSSPSTPRNVLAYFLDRGNMVPCLWPLNGGISDTLWRLDRGNMTPRGDCYRCDDGTGGNMVRCGGDGMVAVPGASLSLPGGEGTILCWWVGCARVLYPARRFDPRSEGMFAVGPFFLCPSLNRSRFYGGTRARAEGLCLPPPACYLFISLASQKQCGICCNIPGTHPSIVSSCSINQTGPCSDFDLNFKFTST